MASEKPPAPAAAPAGDKEAPKKKGGLKMIIAAAVVVVLEIGTVGVTMKLSSGPKQALAEPITTTKAVEVEKDVEVKLIEASLPNNKSGKLWRYDLQVVAKVSEKNKEKVTALFTEREAEIRDQIRTIVAASAPEALAEPGLETIRRQIAYQLELNIGKDLIKEVLIPKCNPSPIQY
jgi:flagellar basal body-associated protein FliL